MLLDRFLKYIPDFFFIFIFTALFLSAAALEIIFLYIMVCLEKHYAMGLVFSFSVGTFPVAVFAWIQILSELSKYYFFLNTYDFYENKTVIIF